jgi:hypothetical protein
MPELPRDDARKVTRGVVLKADNRSSGAPVLRAPALQEVSYLMRPAAPRSPVVGLRLQSIRRRRMAVTQLERLMPSTSMRSQSWLQPVARSDSRRAQSTSCRAHGPLPVGPQSARGDQAPVFWCCAVLRATETFFLKNPGHVQVGRRSRAPVAGVRRSAEI